MRMLSRFFTPYWQAQQFSHCLVPSQSFENGVPLCKEKSERNVTPLLKQYFSQRQ
jgi:hypothetical protein